MYEPLFNQVLVEIDTDSDKWGKGNDDSLLGKDYSKGTVKEIGHLIETKDYPHVPDMHVLGNYVMWNEGHEAGKTFEHDGKLYAFIYWWDLVAVKK